jgi:hypothetical protein
MGARLTGAVVGLIFGVTLSWTGMSSPDVIREALLFEKAYLFLFFGSAVVTAFVGLRVLRAVRVRAVVSPKPIAWETARPKRDTLAGSVLFGIGWGVSDACPGPIGHPARPGRVVEPVHDRRPGDRHHALPAPRATARAHRLCSEVERGFGKPAFGSSRS